MCVGTDELKRAKQKVLWIKLFSSWLVSRARVGNGTWAWLTNQKEIQMKTIIIVVIAIAVVLAYGNLVAFNIDHLVANCAETVP